VKATLASRRARIARVTAKRPATVTATCGELVIEVDPVRRRRIGDALLQILNSAGTPDEGR
jgi:hypothetical protein